MVTGGEIKVAIKFGIIPVYSSTLDLCTILKDAGLSCPVASGNHTATVSQTVPGEVPSVSNVLVHHDIHHSLGLLLIGSGGKIGPLSAKEYTYCSHIANFCVLGCRST